MSETTRANRNGLALLGLSLALGFILSTYIAARTVEKVKLSRQTVKVKGYAERRITSDMAVWRGQFVARSSDLVAAYEKLQKDLDKIIAFIGESGIGKEGVDVSSVSTIVQYGKTEKGFPTNEIEKYVLEQRIEIRSPDVGLVSRLSRESTSLIKEGIEFLSYQPEYFYTKINDLKIELLGEAARDAGLRAEQLAKNSGSRIGPLRSASQGVFQITPVDSTDVSNYGVYDTTTIEKSIKAVVTMEYSIRA